MSDASVYPEESRHYYATFYSAFNPVAVRTILGPQYHCVTRPGLRFLCAMFERGAIYHTGKTFGQRMKSLSPSRKTIARTISEIPPTVTLEDVVRSIRMIDSFQVRATYA